MRLFFHQVTLILLLLVTVQGCFRVINDDTLYYVDNMELSQDGKHLRIAFRENPSPNYNSTIEVLLDLETSELTTVNQTETYQSPFESTNGTLPGFRVRENGTHASFYEILESDRFNFRSQIIASEPYFVLSYTDQFERMRDIVENQHITGIANLSYFIPYTREHNRELLSQVFHELADYGVSFQRDSTLFHFDPLAHLQINITSGKIIDGIVFPIDEGYPWKIIIDAMSTNFLIDVYKNWNVIHIQNAGCDQNLVLGFNNSGVNVFHSFDTYYNAYSLYPDSQVLFSSSYELLLLSDNTYVTEYTITHSNPAENWSEEYFFTDYDLNSILGLTSTSGNSINDPSVSEQSSVSVMFWTQVVVLGLFSYKFVRGRYKVKRCAI